MTRSRDTILSELLAIRFRKGERTAFDELAALWEGKLFYFLRRFTDSEQDAWDLLQQTWIKVLESLGKLRDTSTLPAWLYKVARNTALDNLRRTGREIVSGEANGDPEPVDENQGDLRFENAELVHRGLEQLSLAHREVLTLFFLEEFQVAEIAGILGLSQGTVKSRLHYAKKSLKRILEREGVANG